MSTEVAEFLRMILLLYTHTQHSDVIMRTVFCNLWPWSFWISLNGGIHLYSFCKVIATIKVCLNSLPFFFFYFPFFFSLSQLLTKPSHTPTHPTAYSFSSSLSKKKNPTTKPKWKSKQTLNKRKSKKENKTKSPQKMEPVLCSLRPALECGSHSQWCHREANLFSFFQLVSVMNTFWVRGRTCPHFSFSEQGFSSRLNLCVSYVYCHCLVCPSCCIWKTAFPWSPPSHLTPTIFPFPLLHNSWALRG